MPPSRRLLFCSYHGYLDPSSGAALTTRELLELLAERGWRCEVLCGPRLDFEQPESLEQILRDHGLPYEVRGCPAGTPPFDLICFTQRGVPVKVYRPRSTRLHRAPTAQEGMTFLALLERLLERSRPDRLLTYGGDKVGWEVIAAAKRRGVPVVFGLHNLAYQDAALFHSVDAVLVPSQFARQHYRRTLGLESVVLPPPLNPARVCCAAVEGRYVTFVNPQPAKGVSVFARIALELWRRRPDIPLLVVEGRGTVSWLGRVGLDLAGVGNVHVMANTPDPRDFYRVSRLVLMPSLVGETFGRVAAEALANGIPVLASPRGALPETLADAGFLLDIPERYTPESRQAPTAQEVAPWVETTVRLWDNAACYERERQRCLAAAAAWHPDRLARDYEAFLARILAASGAPPPQG
jgi:glycosyltransferase involved in cell wall biosynthesis